MESGYMGGWVYGWIYRFIYVDIYVDIWLDINFIYIIFLGLIFIDLYLFLEFCLKFNRS